MKTYSATTVAALVAAVAVFWASSVIADMMIALGGVFVGSVIASMKYRKQMAEISALAKEARSELEQAQASMKILDKKEKAGTKVRMF